MMRIFRFSVYLLFRLLALLIVRLRVGVGEIDDVESQRKYPAYSNLMRYKTDG